MIVTVTANTTLDYVMFVDNLRLSQTLTATSSLKTIGGKPANASKVLALHGIKSLALGIAAGGFGQDIATILRGHGVEVDFVEAKGESRLSVVIADATTRTQTPINSHTLIVEASHVLELKEKFTSALKTATVVVLGGSLPQGMSPEFYKEMVYLAKEHKVPVILDLKPENLKRGLEAGVDFIKPNHEELAGVVGYPIKTYEDALKGGREIYNRYGSSSVISMGSQGAVAVLPDKAYKILPFSIEVVNVVGAGDAVLAGIAYSLGLNKAIEEGLRFGMGTATAVCLHPGTALFDLDLAHSFMARVELIPL